MVDVSGDEVVVVSGGGMVVVSGEVVVASGGWKNGDGQYAFSCSIDYGGVWRSVDIQPVHLLTNSDQIPIHLLHLGEQPLSLVPRMNSTCRVSPQKQALQSLPLPGVNEAIVDVDVDEEIHQYCGSQECL